MLSPSSVLMTFSQKCTQLFKPEHDSTHCPQRQNSSSLAELTGSMVHTSVGTVGLLAGGY